MTSATTEVSVAQVLQFLRFSGVTLGVAESLTGGELNASLTSQTGASDVILGGVIAYSSAAKCKILGVEESLIARIGPVDREIALQMAVGCRRVFSSRWGVATTGEAGPTSASGKPVGSVHVAVAGASMVTCRSFLFRGSRAEIRSATVHAALSLLLCRN